eukprot:scaffold2236_cov152-Skeletonema_menzelii.AAC.4
MDGNNNTTTIYVPNGHGNNKVVRGKKKLLEEGEDKVGTVQGQSCPKSTHLQDLSSSIKLQ